LISHRQVAHEIRKILVAHHVKKFPRLRVVALGCFSIHEIPEREKLRERLLITVTRHS
jgi:hypothetical protein